MTNPNCDGQRSVCTSGEVRKLPLTGGANLILCRHCHAIEVKWRIDRNKQLSEDAKYPLPKWETLEVYYAL